MVHAHQLIFSSLHGKADLESPAHSIHIPNMAVTFDPQALVFELFLDAEHPLVWELAQDPDVDLWLKNLEFSMPDGGGILHAEGFCLMLRTALSEWLESLGVKQSNYKKFEKPEAVRRLLLCPSQKLLQFQGGGALASGNIVCYSGWEMEFLKPSDLKFAADSGVIRFDTSQANRELISLCSTEDFSEVEDRIQACLSLAHGRNLAPVLKVRKGQFLFYGKREPHGQQALAMLREGTHFCALLDQLLKGVLRLETEKFIQARLGIRFFLLGKQSPVGEQGFLQAMICVEAMDKVRDLQESTTAALLGVPLQFAKLLNCMRNQLVHGSGGFQRAFEQVKKYDFKGKRPNLSQGFETLVTKQGELNFLLLWLRLCERLDAFWCSYLGVAPELLRYRNGWRNVSLMPAVDSSFLDAVADKYRGKVEEKKQKAEEQRKKQAELVQENTHLKNELRDLRRKLERYRCDTNPVLHEIRVD